jgi:predicted MFS family arabinose efflux permease
VTRERPWQLDGDDRRLHDVLASLVYACRTVASEIGPFLVVRMLAVTALGQVVVALSSGLAMFAAAGVAVALTTAVAQVIVGVSGRAVPGGRTGETVGRVAMGLILGMVLSRSFAAFGAAALGWRAVFALGALLTGSAALSLRRILPPLPPQVRMSYPELVRSLLVLVREHAELRWLLPCGFSAFAALSAVWTSISFMLARPPQSHDQAVIAWIALLGAFGALGGRWSGGRADDHAPRIVSWALPAIVAAAVALGAGATPGAIWLLVLGLMAFDAAVQAANIATRTMVLDLEKTATGRLNAVYATVSFSGGAVGGGLGALAYAAYGWVWVCGLAAVFPTLAWCGWRLSPYARPGPAR